MATIKKIFNFQFSIFKQSEECLIGNSLEIRNCKLGIERSAGYTLIELLIVIAIIGILSGLLVPMVDRSLSVNRLANDVEVFRSKLEETRLLAGSTRPADNQITGNENLHPGYNKAGFYGVYIPSETALRNKSPFYAIIRISSKVVNGVLKIDDDVADTGYCSIYVARQQAESGSGDCLVEKIILSKGVDYLGKATNNNMERVIAFNTPTQETYEIFCNLPCNGTTNKFALAPQPNFDRGGGAPQVYFDFYYKNRQAVVSFQKYTAKMTVGYQSY